MKAGRIESDAISVPLREDESGEEHWFNGNTNERDGPGQNCTYIPPGDHCTETYRLSTFATFPKDIPIKTTELAMMGFYYTGYKDRVRCFSCGGCVGNFVVGDSAFDRRWHRSECLMVIGQETSNVPTNMSELRVMFMQVTGKQGPRLSANNFSRPSIPGDAVDLSAVTGDVTRVHPQGAGPELIFANIVDSQHEATLRSLNLRMEEHRRKTFTKWPSYPCPDLPGELARDGFFYLGNLDRVQCFSCSGVLRNWAPGDVVREEHLRHFPQCRFAKGEETRNIAMTAHQLHLADEEERVRAALRTPNENSPEPPNQSPEEQLHLASYFPCNEALSPNMESLRRRIETFQRWPQNTTRATPQQIAAAGFFYLGESDKTKCYYCNGGLQNWDYTDEPWTEHAKWFPGCEFVIRQKGVEFVRRTTDLHPNLKRLSIRNAVSYENFPTFIPSCNKAGPSSGRKRYGMVEAGPPGKLARWNRGSFDEANHDHRASEQSCRYRPFPSGQENKEEVRLATFAPLVDRFPVLVKKLAKDGFFYTGVACDAKCFSCGVITRNWTRGGLQPFHHDQKCTMSKNSDERNVPWAWSGAEALLSSSFGTTVTNSSTEQPRDVLCECLLHDTPNQKCFVLDEAVEIEDGDDVIGQLDEDMDSDDSSDEENPPCRDIGDVADVAEQDDLFRLSRGA